MAVIDDIKKIPSRLFAPDPRGLSPNELKGIPGNVQRYMDDTAAAAGKKIWKGMVHSIGSGLGKGVVIAAALVIAWAAFSSGFGELAAGAAFMPAFGSGISTGFWSLFSPGGALIMGVGAVTGSIMEIRHNQSKITAEVAQAEATAYEAIRMQKQIERTQALADSFPDVNFAARELAKRDAPQTSLIK
jgi:hypothetical protein